jgi:membrane-bound metal-dependent hydrolase YbcI (DUF457 family)
MKGSTHLVAGAAAGLAVARYAGISEPEAVALVTATAAVASLVPDWIQVNVPGMNRTIKGAFGHRGFSHWLLTAAAIYVAVGRVQPAASGIPLAAAAGWLSHIILDALNKPGVPAFWPLPWRLRLAAVKTGGTGDQFVAWLAGLAGVYLMFDLWRML